jgi:small subunit ribosomal protein S2e
MADRGATRGGFASRGGDRGGDRGRGGRGRGRGRRGPKNEEKEWQPVTKLGRLVKAGKIKSMEEIYLHSLPIKEYQIVDFFLPTLKDEVMKVRPTRPPSLGFALCALRYSFLRIGIRLSAH